MAGRVKKQHGIYLKGQVGAIEGYKWKVESELILFEKNILAVILWKNWTGDGGYKMCCSQPSVKC